MAPMGHNGMPQQYAAYTVGMPGMMSYQGMAYQPQQYYYAAAGPGASLPL